MHASSELPPYPTEYIEKIKPLIHDGIIEYMAQLDAGDLNAGPQTRAIRALLESDRIPTPIRFEPGESLCLAAFFDPSDPAWADGPMTTHESHLARMFGCACMLAAYPAHPYQNGRILSPTQTIPRLIESTIAIQSEWLHDLAGLIRWSQMASDAMTDDSRSEWYFSSTLSRIALVMIDATRDTQCVQPGDIATRTAEIFERRKLAAGQCRPVWRFFIHPDIFGRSESQWIRLAHSTIANPPPRWSKADQDAARLLAHHIIHNELAHRFGMES